MAETVPVSATLFTYGASVDVTWSIAMTSGFTVGPSAVFLAHRDQISTLDVHTGASGWTFALPQAWTLRTVAALPDGGVAVGGQSDDTNGATGIVAAVSSSGVERWNVTITSGAQGAGTDPHAYVVSLAAGPDGEVAAAFRTSSERVTVGDQEMMAPQYGGVALFGPDGALRFTAALPWNASDLDVATDGTSVYVAGTYYTGHFLAVDATGMRWQSTANGDNARRTQVYGVTPRGLFATISLEHDTLNDPGTTPTLDFLDFLGFTATGPGQALLWLAP